MNRILRMIKCEKVRPNSTTKHTRSVQNRRTNGYFAKNATWNELFMCTKYGWHQVNKSWNSLKYRRIEKKTPMQQQQHTAPRRAYVYRLCSANLPTISALLDRLLCRSPQKKTESFSSVFQCSQDSLDAIVNIPFSHKCVVVFVQHHS